MSDIGGLQLLPETRKKIEIKLPGQNRILVLSFIVLALFLGIYFGLVFYKQSLLSTLSSIDKQLSDFEKSRDKHTETKLLDLNQQLAVVNPLIGSHLLLSEAFTKIQSLVQPQVQFKSINVDVLGKKILITALAANYTTIARQIASFYTIDSVTDIILNKVQSQPTGQVELTMQLFFKPDGLTVKVNPK
ncbi:MAG: hypothetical protein HYT61_03940 [Candidatus Yanofskybacteria bacterium]|nr:hypothetical protein [Candidatus Yanofskybacteria bacterium]